MCVTVISLGCLGVTSESVAIDTYVKCIPNLSLSQIIYKVTCVFQLAFVGTSILAIIQFHIRYRYII